MSDHPTDEARTLEVLLEHRAYDVSPSIVRCVCGEVVSDRPEWPIADIDSWPHAVHLIHLAATLTAAGFGKVASTDVVDADKVRALIKRKIAESESSCGDCGRPVKRVEKTQVVFHPTMPSFTEWVHEQGGYWCNGSDHSHARPREVRVDLNDLRALLPRHGR